MTKRSPFRYFKNCPEIIRFAVMLDIRSPLAAERRGPAARAGIEICHETVRYGWNRFGPMFAREIRSRRVEAMRAHRHW